ncbi:hypothetical protein [Streptomyces sp. NBC_01187]|uniref:hypothetical protein n=1 Tax=Streptomyces sp. NBC_01187 TaxID=2903766 RepID=UPI003869E5E8|nr:hypothetical protein OG220_40180 [Streptomyces sp. NBC_01187]WSS47110.1 hypothetical protein OG220_41445 [Streptomyces sp. NBC_01187]
MSVPVTRWTGQGRRKDPPWVVSDDLWERIEPLLPVRQRRRIYPGRLPLDDLVV